jgi:phenylacetate-CoA ligase
MPMIRYRMSDVLRPIDDDIHAPYRAVSDIVGRIEQSAAFLNQSGTLETISPHTLNEIMVPNISKFQLRIHGPESFTFAIACSAGMDAGKRVRAKMAAAEKMHAILREKQMGNVRFDVIQCDDLPNDSGTGKFRLIVQTSPGEKADATQEGLIAFAAD